MDTVTSQRTDSLEGSLEGVVEVLTRTLGIEDRAASITRDTGLFGELPELDSLGVVELAAALEDRFDIVIDDDDFTGEVFESVGTLTDFVDDRLASAD
jgi:acyl carrier protein